MTKDNVNVKSVLLKIAVCGSFCCSAGDCSGLR